MALAAPSNEPQFFEYFLNPAHHKAGIPLEEGEALEVAHELAYGLVKKAYRL